MNMNTDPKLIPARPSPGLPRAAPTVSDQDGGGKFATGRTTDTINGRKNITIATWNVRSLRDTGKLEELTHEMDRYEWDILGLCEMRWKNFGETSTEDGHRLYFSGREDTHEKGVGFLVHKSNINSIMSCRPVSSRLITIRLKATPFNLTIIQAYAPTSDYDDEQIEEFYDQLQEILNQTPKKDVLVVQGDWNAKVGEDAYTNYKGTCGPHCNAASNERGLRLLEFASLNDLVLANTLGPHKLSRKTTWHSPNGKHHNQIDYIMLKTRFRSSINTGKTRSFPGADIGSDHDLVMMTIRLHLKKINKKGFTRIRFDLEKLKDPRIAEAFQAEIGGKFAVLNVINADMDMDTQIDTFNSVVTETAHKIIGKYRPTKKPWITSDIDDLCDERRKLKKTKTKNNQEANKYRSINLTIRKNMRMAKKNWIEEQCNNIESCLRKNNSKKAYQLVKDLTTTKHGRSTTIQDKNLTELEATIHSLKKGKAAGVDNIPAELVKAGGETIVNVLLDICNKIWTSGEWPKPWTQSLVITLPKKGNLQLCQNYRTISLICHPSKVMLKIILNRLRPYAENIIAEEQAGFRQGRSTIEQIFNLRILCEKYAQHQQELYHVFVDFKKAFDRVWHAALWATMQHYNINSKLTEMIRSLYDKATSAVFFNNNIGDWFRTTVGVRQGCLLSPTLFNIFLERIMSDALEDHEGTVSIGGRTITNLRFADDIDGLAGSEEELANLVKRLDKTSISYGMQKNQCRKNKTDD